MAAALAPPSSAGAAAPGAQGAGGAPGGPEGGGPDHVVAFVAPNQVTQHALAVLAALARPGRHVVTLVHVVADDIYRK